MARQKTQTAEDGEKISSELPPAGHEHAHPDSVVVDEDHVKEGADKVLTKAEAEDEKLVTVTVTKDHAVWDGDGSYYEVGTKLENLDEDTAKSLRDKGVAK
ncbi:hypothetical protein [Sphingobium abikonense]|uniref:hypothetical protein n=1 Tax=Sphingobium abikonense TaxID=86193 RepID=UPI0035145820